MYHFEKLNNWLGKSPKLTFVLFGWMTAFVTYSGTYAFRKPIGAATFAGMEQWGVDYKILVLTAQLIGYTLSKFIGVKYVSEMNNKQRPWLILILISIAATSLILFAIVPAPYNIFFMVLNGLPLGMVWGIVFSYLEGRTTTELLGAGLSTTQIFSSGIVKSVGKWLMLELNVSEFWMPAITGLLFLIPLVLSVWLMDHLPVPSKEDERQRTKRMPMDGKARWKFYLHFGFGLSMLLLLYVLLCVFRDFRDNFAAEIWVSLGKGNDAAIFTQTETPIFVVMLVIIALMMRIKNNMLAFQLNHLLLFGGCLLIAGATWLFESHMITPEVWITLIGFGLYVGYVPYQIMLMDRLIAAFKYVSTVSFLLLLSDGLGYLGSTGLLLYKNFGMPSASYLTWMIKGSYIIGFMGATVTLVSSLYFIRRYKSQTAETTIAEPVMSGC
ncbi:DUF5690 family protein [Limibacter armeniacum]|uniref:DUF5690 family protein n=1 Tax=Limibacter armeniacum TaxID=466084 RepID=UPI002FE51E6B